MLASRIETAQTISCVCACVRVLCKFTMYFVMKDACCTSTNQMSSVDSAAGFKRATFIGKQIEEKSPFAYNILARIYIVFFFWRGRLCFGGVKDRGFVSHISLFFRVFGWWVCVCLYMRVHTHKLLRCLMRAQVWDRHLESQKNPDRLKRSTHVDRIGVHSTFVYIYAVLRVLTI